MFLRAVWLILKKDLTVEARSREIVYTAFFFAVACVLVFAFAIVQEGRAPENAGTAVLWVSVLFAGNLALARTFERERQAETLRALLLAPTARTAVYTGKLLGIVFFLGVIELMLVPLVALLFPQTPLLRHPFWLALLLLGGTMGFAAVGTLFAAMLVRSRTRDVMLPILLYPITVPVMIAGVRGTSALLQETPEQALAIMWIGILAAFDAVFITLSLWTFEPLMTE